MRRFVLTLALLIPVVGIGCNHNLRSHGCSSCGGSGFGGGGGCGDACGGRGGGLGGRLLGGHGARNDGCRSCGGSGGHGGGLLAGLGGGAPQHVSRMSRGEYFQGQAGPPGPPTATYAYPYYTLRAPRDFLMDNPPTIGR